MESTPWCLIRLTFIHCYFLVFSIFLIVLQFFWRIWLWGTTVFGFCLSARNLIGDSLLVPFIISKMESQKCILDFILYWCVLTWFKCQTCFAGFYCFIVLKDIKSRDLHEHIISQGFKKRKKRILNAIYQVDIYRGT